MKLSNVSTSPFVRKVRACAITRGIDQKIELVPTNLAAASPEFMAINPLGKVPALVTDDGVALFDSPVICEYLDSVGDALPMFPAKGPARWLAALGYAGWSEGQLDREMTRHGWFAAQPSEGLIYDTPADARWSQAFAAAGVDTRMLTATAGRA